MNCEKTSALCPSSTTSSQLRQQHVELGGRLVDAARIDQAGMAGRLAQAQQRLEHLHLRFGQPVARDAREQRRPVVRAQLVVERRCGASSSQWIVCSVRGGSSGATCSLVRRRMNGRSARAKQRQILAFGARLRQPSPS